MVIVTCYYFHTFLNELRDFIEIMEIKSGTFGELLFLGFF